MQLQNKSERKSKKHKREKNDRKDRKEKKKKRSKSESSASSESDVESDNNKQAKRFVDCVKTLFKKVDKQEDKV
jgi:hypothetical protein